MEARDRVRSVAANEVLKSQAVNYGRFRFVAVARPGRITVEMPTLNSERSTFYGRFRLNKSGPGKAR